MSDQTRRGYTTEAKASKSIRRTPRLVGVRRLLLALDHLDRRLARLERDAPVVLLLLVLAREERQAREVDRRDQLQRGSQRGQSARR